MKLRPLPLALAVAALSPASALAAPQWSAPLDVIPAPAAGTVPGTANSAPQVGIAGGRTFVGAGSGTRALVARGSVGGVFTEPITAGTASGGGVGTDMAVGADGTVVVGWAAANSGHVSIITPSGDVLPQADLPGNGVN